MPAIGTSPDGQPQHAVLPGDARPQRARRGNDNVGEAEAAQRIVAREADAGAGQPPGIACLRQAGCEAEAIGGAYADIDHRRPVVATRLEQPARQGGEHALAAQYSGGRAVDGTCIGPQVELIARFAIRDRQPAHMSRHALALGHEADRARRSAMETDLELEVAREVGVDGAIGRGNRLRGRGQCQHGQEQEKTKVHGGG
ncbi:MAG: hypothetical protein NTV97_23775 [Alphaproteobacteria bacterium]|nr:hypothetical protein [Alphaproteobacteria bacterium]